MAASTSSRRPVDGFTLIELLIVVVILGILAAIAVFAVGNLGTSSAQTACQSDWKAAEVAVESYRTQVGVYPTAGAHGIPALATDAVPATTANGLIAGDTTDTPNLGPWLRDQPTNAGHYRIEVPLGSITINGATVTGSGSGTVQVYDPTGTTEIGSTGSTADCTNPLIK